MTISDEFLDSLESLRALKHSGQDPFGQILSRKQLLVDDFKSVNQKQLNSDNTALRETATRIANNIPHALQCMLLCYAFAMWDEIVMKDPSIIDRILDPSELDTFRAFKHVRNVVAHNQSAIRKLGRRPAQERAFENKMPFSNIQWDETTQRINLSGSNVAYDCIQFLQVIGDKAIVELSKSESI